jgi:N-acetylmuramoyl-L-alanine amidase
MLFSWLAPFITIPIIYSTKAATPAYTQVLQVVAQNNSDFEQVVIKEQSQFTMDHVLLAIALGISFIFIFRFLQSLWKIRTLIKTFPSKPFMGLKLVLIHTKGSPFSFFKYIFWNTSIDIQSEVGKKILNHELIHVKEKHSYDKLWVEMSMIAGWFNPVFWWIKNELYLIHEFIADQQSIENKDTAALAEILLAAAYPQQKHILSNSFFFSPIKRRIAMLTKTTNIRYSYFRRLAVLPILFITFALCAFRTAPSLHTPIALVKPYTIVLDAGHGGKDLGANSPDGQLEKDFTLSIVNKIKALNKNEQLHIVLTRSTDEMINVVDRANQVNAIHPDLMISVHLNAVATANNTFSWNENHNGVELYIPKTNKDKPQLNMQSNLLASTLNQTTAHIFSANRGVMTREKGIWILDAAQCPAVIIECGSLTSKSDLKVLETQQDQIAASILQAAELYLTNKDQVQTVVKKDTSINAKVQEALSKANIKKVVKDALSKVNIDKTVKDALDNIDLDQVVKDALKSVDLDKVVREATLASKQAIKKVTPTFTAPVLVKNDTAAKATESSKQAFKTVNDSVRFEIKK